MANNEGRFVWYELLTSDPKAAIAFYTEVIGWKTQPFDDKGEYMMWVSDQGPLGGVMKLPEEAKKMGAPSHWMSHVQVADVDATVARARKLDAKIHKEPSDIPKVGRFAVIAGSRSTSRPCGPRSTSARATPGASPSGGRPSRRPPPSETDSRVSALVFRGRYGPGCSGIRSKPK